MSNEKSCVGCKFLYMQDTGYSNYTVEGTDAICAKGRNPNLGAEVPYDWKQNPDNWSATNESRCELYEFSEITVSLDVDGECKAAAQTDDAEVIAAIDGESN